MSERGSLTREERDRDDGRLWGFMDGPDFVALPKLPLLRAGFGPPPFTLTLPHGEVRHVVHLPTDADLPDGVE
jgi:hypothetical protein